MSLIIPLLLFAAVVNTAPIDQTNKESDSTSENDAEQQRGITDILNPFNKNNASQQTPASDKKEENNGPLAPLQNLFNNVPQINLLNGSNPFEQLFSSQPGGNILDNVKVFLVGSGGVVFPASAMLGGFQNFMQTLGNLGNMAQGVQNVLPSLPVGK